MTDIYDFSVRDIDGKERSLGEFRGKTLLVVNVASRCGFTPQYTGLEALWRQWRDRGLVVLGFPCDQFGHQEPGDEAEIRQFCSTSYDVTPQLNVYFTAQNLTNATMSTHGRWPDQVLDVFDYGRRLTIGLHYRY